MDHTQALSDALGGMALTDIARLPESVVEEAITSLGLPLPERAQLHLAVLKQGQSLSLAAHFAEQERRRVDPWRAQAAKLEAERQAIERESRDQRRSQFIDLAKNGLVSVEDCMAASYLLFGSPAAQAIYEGLLLRRRDLDRIVAHNFYVGSMLEESFLARYGSKLLSFPLPLFPPVAEMTALNLKMLEQYSPESPVGGAANFFRRQLFAGAADFRPIEATGAGYIPVGQLENGATVADTTALEQYIDANYSRRRAPRAKAATPATHGPTHGPAQGQAPRPKYATRLDRAPLGGEEPVF